MKTGGKGPFYQLLSREEKLGLGIAEDPVITLVDNLLSEAISFRASDIHLQPYENGLIVRYRIDGILYNKHFLFQDQAPVVLSRLKVLASLDIARQRTPQDGRLKVSLHRTQSQQKGEGPIIDFRISTYPTLHGEKMVIRILDRSLRLLSLDSLGLQTPVCDQLKTISQQPSGLFLVTGPTGSGKTTTLYALISSLDATSKNIITIEDPVEYELKGITQSQVNPKTNFSFENGLRAILRQDPDIILVGEIRDKATAQIATEAALTGHLVLSTLHTNDAPSTIVRLTEMGIEPFLISATLAGILAQRLVRCLCPACRILASQNNHYSQIPEEIKKWLKKQNFEPQNSHVAVGCKKCHNIGYLGRTGIFELLTINDTIQHLIGRTTDTETLRKQAINDGMQTLLQDGTRKARDKKISLEELIPFLLKR